MKVCTDACILGAWSAEKLKDERHILDIGAGTGLLSLMLAQKTEALIDALEINPDAASQAEENVNATEWSNRMHIIHASLQAFIPIKLYDFIISNPPFFDNDLHSPNAERTSAMHDSSMTLEELFSFIEKHLSKHGRAAVLVPFHRTTFVKSLISFHGMVLNEELILRHAATHSPFRSILLFSKTGELKSVDELLIHDGTKAYTDAFVKLLKDYYLYL